MFVTLLMLLPLMKEESSSKVEVSGQNSSCQKNVAVRKITIVPPRHAGLSLNEETFDFVYRYRIQ
jgi:hypothetical protein